MHQASPPRGKRNLNDHHLTISSTTPIKSNYSLNQTSVTEKTIS